MAIPDGLLKLVVSGSFNGGTENWAFSLWHSGYTLPGTGGSLSLSALEASSTWTAFRTAVTNLMRATDQINQLDSYYYQGGVAVAHETLPTVHVGTSAGNPHPSQIAAVLSLRTGLATRSGRGRIYLPATAWTLDAGKSTGAASVINAACDALAAYASGFTGSPRPHVVVVSQTHSMSTPITSVSCDNVPDTQRRRRNKTVGVSHSAAVT